MTHTKGTPRPLLDTAEGLAQHKEKRECAVISRSLLRLRRGGTCSVGHSVGLTRHQDRRH